MHTGVCIYLLHSPYCLIQVAQHSHDNARGSSTGQRVPCRHVPHMCTLARTGSTTVMYTKLHSQAAKPDSSKLSPQTNSSQPLLTSRAALWCLASCCPGAVMLPIVSAIDNPVLECKCYHLHPSGIHKSNCICSGVTEACGPAREPRSKIRQYLGICPSATVRSVLH